MITLENVCKDYPGGRALHEIDLSFPEGQIIGILGRNGAGKSTLLKAIAGLCTPTYGRVLIDGKDPREVKEKTAFISEEGSYFPNMRPMEYGQYLSTFYEMFDRERYYKMLDLFEVDNKPIKHLSKGQRGKVEISAGFSKGAKYLLMDEPFLGADIVSRKLLVKILASTFQEDQTIIIASHLIDEVENMLDRAVFLQCVVKGDVLIEEIKKEGKQLSESFIEVCGGMQMDVGL